MSRVVGYTDRASAIPGETIACHVGLLGSHATESAEYQAALVKIVGYDAEVRRERVQRIASPVDGAHAARRQQTRAGAYAVAQLKVEETVSGISVHTNLMPTRLPNEVGVVSVYEIAARGMQELSLLLDAAGSPVLLAGNGEDAVHRFALPTQLTELEWYQLSAGFGAGEAFIELIPLTDGRASATRRSWPLTRPPELRRPTLFLASRAMRSGYELLPTQHFTGRLEDPHIDGAPTQEGDKPAQPRPIAAWDFAQAMNSFGVSDVTGHGQDLTLHGLPVRAVTGSRWGGGPSSPAESPDQYGAIHFCADAIEDAGWEEAFSLRIPEDLPSGLYGFELDSGEDSETVPFVVAPSSVPASEILVLLPTATYMAYSNARFTWERVNWEVQCESSVVLGRSEQILLDHTELGASSYDQYLDGTNIVHVSWRRPNLDMRVAQKRGENYPSDLRLIEWLHGHGYRYEVAVDTDLDILGSRLLDKYRVVLTGTHPEYVSANCCQALESFIARGGRLAVLGGNAYHFLVAFSDERPWIMEVRKSDNRPAGSRAASEGYLALTGVFGADAEAPRPSESFLGTSSASMGFDQARPYERLPASYEPGAAFIFAGVDARVIGEGLHNGPVFQEWDNRDDMTLGADELVSPVVLARSTDHSVNARFFGATKRLNHAEMTFFSTAAGGAVFSAASMAWCLCLQDDTVSRITANVLDRFLDPADFALRSSR
jgi:N,N-dimethylformamidase